MEIGDMAMVMVAMGYGCQGGSPLQIDKMGMQSTLRRCREKVCDANLDLSDLQYHRLIYAIDDNVFEPVVIHLGNENFNILGQPSKAVTFYTAWTLGHINHPISVHFPCIRTIFGNDKRIEYEVGHFALKDAINGTFTNAVTLAQTSVDKWHIAQCDGDNPIEDRKHFREPMYLQVQNPIPNDDLNNYASTQLLLNDQEGTVMDRPNDELVPALLSSKF